MFSLQTAMIVEKILLIVVPEYLNPKPRIQSVTSVIMWLIQMVLKSSTTKMSILITNFTIVINAIMEATMHKP